MWIFKNHVKKSIYLEQDLEQDERVIEMVILRNVLTTAGESKVFLSFKHNN